MPNEPTTREPTDLSRGWIKLWRKSLKSDVFQDPDLWRLWTYCLMRANHAPGNAFSPRGKTPVPVAAGQFITGRFSLHADLYPKKTGSEKAPTTVWFWLQCLARAGNLVIKTSSHFSLVTIVNWETYQSGNGQNEQENAPPTGSQLAANWQPTLTNKNVKTVENVENVEKTTPAETTGGDVPVSLNTPEFVAAWGDWLIHKGKTYKVVSQKAQLKRLALIGVTRATAAIQVSLASGWKGIFEESDRGTRTPASRVGPPAGHGPTGSVAPAKAGQFRDPIRVAD